MTANARGPLAGLRVIEMQGVGPVPFGCMMLVDLGAEVIEVERPADKGMLSLGRGLPIELRGRRRLEIDLRSSAGLAEFLDYVEKADVLVEGHRPGVMERLGAGPDVCLVPNPRLVYSRVTGWPGRSTRASSWA